MDDYYYKNAHKTKESMRELLKIQSERLKVLNQEVRELKAEQKRTYKEMTYFKNKSRRNQGKIKKAIEYIKEDLQISILPNNQIINGTEVVKRINKIEDILKGEDE